MEPIQDPVWKNWDSDGSGWPDAAAHGLPSESNTHSLFSTELSLPVLSAPQTAAQVVEKNKVLNGGVYCDNVKQKEQNSFTAAE